MSHSSEQSKEELRVFREFVQRSRLPVLPDSIESRLPPEPDIRCELRGEGPVAFELKEICDEGIAKACADLLKSGSEDPRYLRPGNPVSRISKKARNKRYETGCPVELLLYTNGRVVLPPDVNIPDIRLRFDTTQHQFRRVWFMGEPDETCECVYSRAQV